MIIEKVNIKLNRQIADNIWEMVFDAPNIASKYVGAGQFISITLAARAMDGLIT